MQIDARNQYQNAMAALGSAQGMQASRNTIAPQPVPPSPFEEIEITLSSARELCNRIQSIADRMLGPAPESSGGVPERENHVGVIPRLQDASSDTKDAIGAANRACSRLEQALS